MTATIEQATCDRCGPSVRAFSYWIMPSGNELAFCGHCGTLNREALEKQGGRELYNFVHTLEKEK